MENNRGQRLLKFYQCHASPLKKRVFLVSLSRDDVNIIRKFRLARGLLWEPLVRHWAHGGIVYRPTGLPWLEPMKKTIVRSIGARVSIKRLKKVIGVLVANLE